MKTVYAIIHKEMSSEGEKNYNSYASVDQQRVVEEFNKEVDDLCDWSNPDVSNNVVTAKQIDKEEYWRTNNYSIALDYANQVMHQISIAEMNYKKKNIYFKIECELNANLDTKFTTLKEAKEFIVNALNVSSKKVPEILGTIKKYQEFVLDKDTSIYNCIMENHFRIKNDKIHYDKQIKYE